MDRARLPGLAPGQRHPDWHLLYQSADEKKLPWFFPELDPDVGQELAHADESFRKILDVGCGLGNQSHYMAALGFDVTGTDVSTAAVNRARSLYPGVRFLVDDVTKTTLAETFDIVVDRGCFHVLEIASYPAYLAAMSKILRPGGLLLLKTFSSERGAGEFGPMRFSFEQIHELFVGEFEVVRSHRTLYQGATASAPVALFCVLRRRNDA